MAEKIVLLVYKLYLLNSWPQKHNVSPRNFPLSQKLLDFEGFGMLPPELLLLSGH